MLTNEKLDEIWRIMKEKNFDFYQKINEELKCSICDKLMIKATNGPCGCRYCWNCIFAYLNGEEKLCPGKRKYCHEMILDFNKNIELDRATNAIISSLDVKCPKPFCKFKDDIIKMDEHFKTCNENQLYCPYFDVGCKNDRTIITEIHDHLSKENYSHTKLLIEYILNQGNELEILKREINDVKIINVNLKKELKIVKVNLNNKQTAIQQLQANTKLCNSNRDEFIQKMFTLKMENKQIKKEIEQLKATDGIKSSSFIELDEKQLDQIEIIKQKSPDFDKKQIGIIKKYIKINPKNQCLHTKSNQSTRNIKINSMYSPRKLIEIETFEKRLVCNEFLWKIENWKSKIQHAKSGFSREVFSDPFYTHKNGYKMCLSIYPDGDQDNQGTYLSLFFHLIHGEFDNILPWPFRNDVTFSICNHSSNSTYFSDTLKYNENRKSIVYQKPTSERNVGHGYPRFIELNELTKNTDLVQNDRLLIKCKVHVA